MTGKLKGTCRNVVTRNARRGELAVEPQQVVLGEGEAADGRF
jgi:hypothetical protein